MPLRQFILYILCSMVGIILTISILFRCNIAPLERLASPGIGTCAKCERPWTYVDAHQTVLLGSDTITSEGGELIRYSISVFPLCEHCWEELATYNNRIPYYFDLVSRWGQEDNEFNYDKWAEIQQSLYFEEFGELQDLPVEHTQ